MLEPWVLIQLPFRPAVLHQWAVALLAEALKFQLKISDLLIIDSPVVYHPLIEKLGEMNIVMHSSAELSIQYFTRCCAEILTPTEMKRKFKLFTELLPVLKFALSTECDDIIKSLKRMSWNINNDRKSNLFEALQPKIQVRELDTAHFYSQFVLAGEITTP